MQRPGSSATQLQCSGWRGFGLCSPPGVDAAGADLKADNRPDGTSMAAASVSPAALPGTKLELSVSPRRISTRPCESKSATAEVNDVEEVDMDDIDVDKLLPTEVEIDQEFDHLDQHMVGKSLRCMYTSMRMIHVCMPIM